VIEHAHIRQEYIGSDGSILLVMLDHVRHANAYTTDMIHQLEYILQENITNRRCRAMVLTGTGNRSFCSGADLGELRTRTYRHGLDLDSRRVFEALAHVPWPTVAAVNGAAVGGGVELTLACDLRIAAPHARFSLPETALLIIPAAGGTQRLPRLVGPARAKEMILFGRELDADTALVWGLVSDIVADPLSRAIDLAQAAERRDILANQLAKTAIDMITSVDGLRYEGIAQALLYDHQQHE